MLVPTGTELQPIHSAACRARASGSSARSFTEIDHVARKSAEKLKKMHGTQCRFWVHCWGAAGVLAMGYRYIGLLLVWGVLGYTVCSAFLFFQG